MIGNKLYAFKNTIKSGMAELGGPIPSRSGRSKKAPNIGRYRVGQGLEQSYFQRIFFDEIFDEILTKF